MEKWKQETYLESLYTAFALSLEARFLGIFSTGWIYKSTRTDNTDFLELWAKLSPSLSFLCTKFSWLYASCSHVISHLIARPYLISSHVQQWGEGIGSRRVCLQRYMEVQISDMAPSHSSRQNPSVWFVEGKSTESHGGNTSMNWTKMWSCDHHMTHFISSNQSCSSHGLALKAQYMAFRFTSTHYHRK